MAVRALPYITPQEYLARERKSETKSEYHGGVIVARAGASKEHNAITFDIAVALGTQLKDGPCQGYASDLRVRVPQCDRYYYPDVIVVCGEPQFEDAELDTLLNPTLLIEVLSESTEKADREEKFDCYGTLESLTTYVLVAQDRPRVESFTRLPDGTWKLEIARGLDAVMRLGAIGCELRLAEIYARVEFPAQRA